jgi:(p)ppGpp synthase/HD superfamily hydrolase
MADKIADKKAGISSFLNEHKKTNNDKETIEEFKENIGKDIVIYFANRKFSGKLIKVNDKYNLITISFESHSQTFRLRLIKGWEFPIK